MKKQHAAIAHLYADIDAIDANMGQVQDAKSADTWQQLIAYTIQAAKQNELYGDRAENKIYFHNTQNPADSNYFDHHQGLEGGVENPQVVKELDCLARIVRLRALLSIHCEKFNERTGQKEFNEPWDFTAFAHWFLDAFYLPITKVWL